MKKSLFVLLALFSLTLANPEIRGRFLASVEEKVTVDVEQLEATICLQKSELEHSKSVIDNLTVQLDHLKSFVYSNLQSQQQPQFSYRQSTFELPMAEQQQDMFSNYWQQNWEMLQLKMQLSYYQNQNQNLTGYGQVNMGMTPSLDTAQFNQFRPLNLQPQYGQLNTASAQFQQDHEFNFARAPLDYNQLPDFSAPTPAGFNFN